VAKRNRQSLLRLSTHREDLQLIARQVRLVRDGVASVLDMRPLTIGSPVLELLV
jgi:hypothetical protein